MSRATNLLNLLEEHSYKAGDTVEFTKDFTWDDNGKASGWKTGQKATVAKVDGGNVHLKNHNSSGSSFPQNVCPSHFKKA